MTHPPDPGPVPALKGVSKSFGAAGALRDVSLELPPGQAHALAGEHGAGKPTLIKTLAGAHPPDAGQVLPDGRPDVVHGPGDARDAGIPVSYQEPTLFPDLSIAENIFLGRRPKRALGRGVPQPEGPDGAVLDVAARVVGGAETGQPDLCPRTRTWTLGENGVSDRGRPTVFDARRIDGYDF